MKRIIPMFVLVLCVIGLVIGLVFSLKVIVRKNDEINAFQRENAELQATITTLKESMDNNITNKKEEIKEKIEYKSVDFDESKITNKEENTKITKRLVGNSSIMNVQVNNEEKTLTIALNSEYARLIYGYSDVIENHTVAGFGQNIKDVKIACIGSNAQDLKIIMLMEDGTIKYVNVQNILDRSYTVQNVPEIENVSQIVEVDIENITDSTLKYGVVAVKEDGTCTILKIQ